MIEDGGRDCTKYGRWEAEWCSVCGMYESGAADGQLVVVVVDRPERIQTTSHQQEE